MEKIDLQGGFDMHNDKIGFGETGTKILTRNLQPLPGQSRINVTLERFAENLEKLVMLDKLGSPQHGGRRYPKPSPQGGERSTVQEERPTEAEHWESLGSQPGVLDGQATHHTEVRNKEAFL